MGGLSGLNGLNVVGPVVEGLLCKVEDVSMFLDVEEILSGKSLCVMGKSRQANLYYKKILSGELLL